MACEVCEHCQGPVSRDEVTMRDGFSYHKRCHKCYVCSETNLQNAEVFKGVIFCSSCSQRIFQGCSTARRTKTTHAGRLKRTRSRSHKRRDRIRILDRRTVRSRDGVIELAGLAGSTTTTDSNNTRRDQKKKASKEKMSTEMPLHVGKETHTENCFHMQQISRMKKDSTEMGTATDVTQELLKQINCPIPECRAEHRNSPQTILQPRKYHKWKNNIIEQTVKPICSDLRIAELGVSTEIANMALRKKSEVPIIIKSDTWSKGRMSYTLSVLNQESDVSGDDGTDWLDSAYSTIDELSEPTNMMDRRLGSILKMPLKFFKKNILTRSSLISVLISNDGNRNINVLRKLKKLLREETVEHQGRGCRRLYSTINRRKTPYKLGWVDLVAKVSKVRKNETEYCTCKKKEEIEYCTCKKKCHHFKNSHSYRCMRAHVMKLAGPTNSKLACYRSKIKKIVSPQFFRDFLNSSKSI